MTGRTRGIQSPTDWSAAAAQIAAITTPVVSALTSLGRFTAGALSTSQSDLDIRSAVGDLAGQILLRQPLVVGAGVAIKDERTDTDPSFLWWVRNADLVIQKRHVTNPRSDAFYDVGHARWFQAPIRSSEPVLLGPYVDSWGTDDFTMTASLPVTNPPWTVVAAADLNTRTFLQRAERLLADAGALALVDREMRIVASTDARYEIGSRMRALSGGVTSFKAAFGWSVIGAD